MNKKLLIGLLVILTCGIIIWLMIDHNQDKTKKQEPKQETVKKKQSSKKIVSSLSSSESQKISDDNVNLIDEFFTAYQQYNSTSSKAVDRANLMLNDATEDVVNQLMPGALNNKPDQDYKFEVDYQFLQPIKIEKVVNSDKYQVTLNYRVTVGKNHSDHKDVYIVSIKDGKINSVVQQSAELLDN